MQAFRLIFLELQICHLVLANPLNYTSSSQPSTPPPAAALLQQNPACHQVKETIASCASVSPSFINAAPATQASCLCSPAPSGKDPNPFDDVVKTCADYASTAVPSVYGVLYNLEGFCSRVGIAPALVGGALSTTTSQGALRSIGSSYSNIHYSVGRTAISTMTKDRPSHYTGQSSRMLTSTSISSCSNVSVECANRSTSSSAAYLAGSASAEGSYSSVAETSSASTLPTTATMLMSTVVVALSTAATSTTYDGTQKANTQVFTTPSSTATAATVTTILAEPRQRFGGSMSDMETVRLSFVCAALLLFLC